MNMGPINHKIGDDQMVPVKFREFKILLNPQTEDSIVNILTNAYRLGYERLVIQFSKDKTRGIIEDLIKNRLIGLKLKLVETHKIVIEDILKKPQSYHDYVLFKLLAKIDLLFNFNKNWHLADKYSLETLENQIQLWDNLSRRVIIRSNGPLFHLRLAFNTELCHAQKEIYFALIELVRLVNPSKETLGLLESSKEIYNLLKKAYVEESIAYLDRIHDLHKEIFAELGCPLLNNSNSNERVAIHHLLQAIRNLSMTTSPLIGLFMHNNLEARFGGNK